MPDLAPPAAITADRLKRFAPQADETALAPALQRAADQFGVSTTLRVAHWLARLHVESAGLTRTVESLNYGAEALKALFSRARISAADCDRLGRTAAHPAYQEALANVLYGGAWGAAVLGNTEPGDGWRYRGRGLAQITGRANYRAAARDLGPPWEEQPDLVAATPGAALSAGWVWHARGAAVAADRDDVEAVCRAWNGGLNGLEDQRRQLARAKTIWRS